MRKYLLTLSFVLAFGLISSLNATPVAAAVLEKNIERTYTVTKDFVNVVERLEARITDSQYFIPANSEEVFVIFNPVQDDSNARDKINRTIPTIKITDATGANVNFTTAIEGQNILIRASYPQAIRFNNNQVLRLEYRSFALLFTSGAVRDLYIPSFSKDYQFETAQVKNIVDTKVILPKSLGEINFVTPQVTPTDKGNDWELGFNQASLTGTLSWIQLGTVQYYEFAIKQPYSKTSDDVFLSNTYRVALPREVTAGPFTQKTFFTTLNPKPSSVELDVDGNMIGVFSVPANTNGEIVINGYIEIRDNRKFDIKSAGSLADVPSSLLDRGTKSATYWEVDSNEIKGVASEIRGSETDIYKIMVATYNYVVDRIDYSEVKRFGINERQGALRTLQGGAAVCMEYSDLFIALMRAHGIPARAAFGYGYDSRSSAGINTAHQWAEVYLPAYQTWVLVDTTWGESGSAVIGSDLNHFYKYVATSSPLEPAPVTVEYVGNITEIPNETFTITPRAAALTGTAQTQADLIAAYPAANSTPSNSLLATLQNIDKATTRLLSTTLQIQDGNLLTAAKIAVYVLINGTIVGTLFIVIKRIVSAIKHARQTPSLQV